MDAITLNDRQSKNTLEPTRRDEASAGEILLIDLNLLDDNPYQARTEREEAKAAELRKSIAAQGQLQPILVRRMGLRWQIICGHGRVAALRQLRDEPSNEADRRRFARVRAEERLNVSDQQMLVLSLLENLQREDISPVDCAAALDRLKSMLPVGAQSAEAISQEVSMTEEQVKRLLRLHAAPQVVKDAVSKGIEVPVEATETETPGGAPTQTAKRLRLEVSSALEFAKLHTYWTDHPVPEVLQTKTTPDERMAAVIQRALKEEWSVRKVQAVVAKLIQGEPEPTELPEPAPFKSNATKLMIFHSRLSAMTEEQKGELKALLEPIWVQLGGQAHPPAKNSFVEWLRGLRALPHHLKELFSSWRELRKALRENLKVLPTGEVVVREKPAALLPPGQVSGQGPVAPQVE